MNKKEIAKTCGEMLISGIASFALTMGTFYALGLYAKYKDKKSQSK